MDRETILVVDYEQNIRRLMMGVLEGAGYNVLEAVSGQQALELIRQRDIDMIVCNVTIPEMSGIDLMLAAQGIRPGVRVLLTSGRVGDAAARQAPVLQEPDALEPEVLLSEVRRILKPGEP